MYDNYNILLKRRYDVVVRWITIYGCLPRQHDHDHLQLGRLLFEAEEQRFHDLHASSSTRSVV